MRVRRAVATLLVVAAATAPAQAAPARAEALEHAPLGYMGCVSSAKFYWCLAAYRVAEGTRIVIRGPDDVPIAGPLYYEYVEDVIVSDSALQEVTGLYGEPEIVINAVLPKTGPVYIKSYSYTFGRSAENEGCLGYGVSYQLFDEDLSLSVGAYAVDRGWIGDQDQAVWELGSGCNAFFVEATSGAWWMAPIAEPVLG